MNRNHFAYQHHTESPLLYDTLTIRFCDNKLMGCHSGISFFSITSKTFKNWYQKSTWKMPSVYRYPSSAFWRRQINRIYQKIRMENLRFPYGFLLFYSAISSFCSQLWYTF